MTPAALRARVAALADRFERGSKRDEKTADKEYKSSPLASAMYMGRATTAMVAANELRAILSEYDASARGDKPCG